MEKRIGKCFDVSVKSVKIINALRQREQLERGKTARECKTGFFIDAALEKYAKEEGIVV